MATTRVTFAKKTIRITNRYHCKCGKKFNRKLSDWYTISPLNPNTEADTRNAIAEKLMRTAKKCPACSAMVEPAI